MDPIKLIMEEGKKVRRGLEEIVRDLHDHPEVSYEEHRSSRVVREYLSEEGFTNVSGVAGMDTSFVSDWKNGASSPRVGYLVEMDALPGLGHACGHNIVAASSAGAAVILSRIANTLGIKGCVSCFGTPAEEKGFGKGKMAEEGVFDGVDAAMMVHPSSHRVVDKGYLALKRMAVTYHGKAAHAAAYPEEGVNALDATILLFNGVSLLRQQLPGDVRVHGIITDGGAAPNIIPERSSSSFYVRAATLPGLEEAVARFEECVKGAARSSRCRVTIKKESYTLHPMIINPVLAELYREGMKKLGLKEDDVAKDTNLGSSDIGNVSTRVPAIQPLVPIVRGRKVEIHTHPFREATVSKVGFNGMMEGALLLAYTGFCILSDQGVRRRMKKSFKTQAARKERL
jgi:amidohydrolase